MTPNDLHPIEQFFFDWRYTAGAIFSGTAFILAMLRILVLVYQAYLKSVSEAVDIALTNNRHENQAQVIDEFINVIKEQSADSRRYCAVVNKSANINAKVIQLLENNNITLKD